VPSSRDSTSTELARRLDRPALLLVLLVWLGMLAWAARSIALSAPLFPVLDERSAWRKLFPPFGALTWSNLWSYHNEHKIPLPRLVYYLLYVSTGDLRPGLYLQLATLALVALSMILLARRLRGRASFSDAAFPLLWLHTGNAFNLLSGFQFALTLPTALACAVLLAAASSPRRPRTGRALLAGLALAGLPLCGGVGITQAPALAAWSAWTGWRSRRSALPSVRRGGRVLLASVLLCAAFAAIHLWGYRFSDRPSGGLPLPFSPGMSAALLALALLAATVVLLAAALRRTRRERGRGLGILASIAATVCLVLAIASRRSDLDWRSGLLPQYVTLTTPLLCGASFAWEIYGAGLARRLLPALVCAGALAALPGNARIGASRFEAVRGEVADLERTIESGAGPAGILAAYARSFRGNPQLDLAILRLLAAQHRPPFDGPRAVPAQAFDFPTFFCAPSRVEAPLPAEVRFVARDALTVVAAGTRIHLDLRPGDARASGRFGVPLALAGRRPFGDVRVRIELRAKDGSARTLFERELRAEIASDRGLQPFAIDLPPGAEGELVLGIEGLDPREREPRRSCWCDVRIE
jgi:hypothetical protein